MALIIPKAIEDKIAGDDHGNVTVKEVNECFENHCGGYALDTRSQHRDSNSQPAVWFVGETNRGRALKIMFVREHGNIYLKSAYPATEEVQRIYKKYST